MYNAAVLNNNTISKSGSVSNTLFNLVSGGSTITINTTSDVRLLFNSVEFKPGKQINFKVTGPNNLYIYLTGNSNFTVDNQFIGMQSPNDTSKIYIIGDGNQSVKLNNCELDAYVYVPMGSFVATGGHTPYMFQGSCATKSVNIQSSISVNYVSQTIIGTPLEVLNNGQYGSHAANWVVGKWEN